MTEIQSAVRQELKSWIETFAKKLRGEFDRYKLDEINGDYYLLFDVTYCEEPEEAQYTTDIYVVPLNSDDWEANKLRVVENANKGMVISFLKSIQSSIIDYRKKLEKVLNNE